MPKKLLITILFYTCYMAWVAFNISDFNLNVAAFVVFATQALFLVWAWPTIFEKCSPKKQWNNRVRIIGADNGTYEIVPEGSESHGFENLVGFYSWEDAYRHASALKLVVTNRKHECPECLTPLHPIRSQFIKMCGSCDYQEPWELKEGQKPLITNNRQKG